MKKTIVILAMLFLSSVSAQAQTDGGMMGEQKDQVGQGMRMGEGQQMQMMQMCMPMMKQMMGQGMMMQDMMQMMTDMMKMQQKTMEGVKPAEKKELAKELSGMQEKMNKMMADMKGMMSQGMMMQGMMGGAASAEAKVGEKIDSSLKTQEREEAGVTAKVSLESMNGAITFKIVLETHTVDLEKYKFDEIVVLRAAGKEYKAWVKSLEGSGHHRSAVIEFDNPKAKEVEIVIKDVAGVKERLFKF